VYVCRPGLVTGISQTDEADVQVHPNPFVNAISISGSSIVEFELFDAKGTLVFSSSSSFGDINTVDLSNLLVGKYLLRVELTDGRSVMRKLIKE